MTDSFLRKLEKEWDLTHAPHTGVHLVLAKLRSGHPVAIEDFPILIWKAVAESYPLDQIAHHLELGTISLSSQFVKLHDSLTELIKVFSGHQVWISDESAIQRLLGNQVSEVDLRIFARALHRQVPMTSVVYYPMVPADFQLCLYVTFIMSSQTLPDELFRNVQEDLGDYDAAEIGVVLRLFYKVGDWKMFFPTQINIATLIPSHGTEPVGNILRNVGVIYHTVGYAVLEPDYPNLSSDQFLVLRPHLSL